MAEICQGNWAKFKQNSRKKWLKNSLKIVKKCQKNAWKTDEKVDRKWTK